MKSLLIELLIINAIASAILVIIAKNPVISVIFLISLVLNAALFLIVKGMPFIGISYILIYLGAIIVLFLFVIMMINIKLTDILEIGYQYTKNIPLALTVAGLFLFELFNILPYYINNSILPLDNSIIFSFLKEIILTLNNLISSSFNVSLSVFNLGVNSLPSEAAIVTGDAPLEAAKEFLNKDLLPNINILTNYGSGQDILVASLVKSEISKPLLTSNNWPETLIVSYAHIVSVAYSLYTYGAFWFLLNGIILLLAMLAPIYLSRS